MKIDWKRKLTSRKFWAALIEFVTMLLLGFGATESTAAKVTAIIMAGAGLLAYIIAEGLVDSSNTTSVYIEDKVSTEKEKRNKSK